MGKTFLFYLQFFDWSTTSEHCRCTPGSISLLVPRDSSGARAVCPGFPVLKTPLQVSWGRISVFPQELRSEYTESFQLSGLNSQLCEAKPAASRRGIRLANVSGQVCFRLKSMSFNFKNHHVLFAGSFTPWAKSLVSASFHWMPLDDP